MIRSYPSYLRVHVIYFQKDSHYKSPILELSRQQISTVQVNLNLDKVFLCLLVFCDWGTSASEVKGEG